jgi:hypothetical protein
MRHVLTGLVMVSAALLATWLVSQMFQTLWVHTLR